MKKFLFILVVITTLLSCNNNDVTLIESHVDNQDNTETKTSNNDTTNSYNSQLLTLNLVNKILDDYFVTSIAFDKNGNVWIGTFAQGLIKYNANGITVYDSKNSIISDNWKINDIAVDSKNNVWVGTNGLIKIENDNFTLYNSTNSPIPEDYITSISIDSSDNVWFSSSRFRQGGIVKYDGINWNVYTTANSNLPINFIQSIAVDKNNDMWICAQEVVKTPFLTKISNGSWHIYSNADFGFTPFYVGDIQFNSKNIAFISIIYDLSSTIVNDGAQIFTFDGITSKQLQFDNTTRIKSIKIDRNDYLWCVGNNKCAIYKDDKWVIENELFKDKSIFTIEESQNRVMWIGTAKGIYIVNLEN